MKNEILDKDCSKLHKPTDLKVRTKDLIILENFILITSFVFLVLLYTKYGTFAIFEGTTMIITPLLYTIFWRKKSIKFDLSIHTKELQSGSTLIFAFLGVLQSFFLILMGIGEISYNIAIGIITTTYGIAYLFYILKSFFLSYKIDHDKSLFIKN